MISTVFSSSSLSWLVGEFFISLVAISGGVLVLRGLWIEKKADKEEYLDVDDFRSSKLKSKRGWKMLMWGIFVETAVAGIFAAKDGWEIRQIEINAAKNDPRNQNISDMSATAILIVMGTDFNDLTNWDSSRVARMSLWKNERMGTTLNTLNADNFTRNDFRVLFGNPNASNSREYGIRFHSFNFMAFNGLETPVKAIDDVNLVRMEINFLPHGSKIAAGGVDLVVNNIHKIFQIFPQIDTNSPVSGTPGSPYMVIATNVDHEPVK